MFSYVIALVKLRKWQELKGTGADSTPVESLLSRSTCQDRVMLPAWPPFYLSGMMLHGYKLKDTRVQEEAIVLACGFFLAMYSAAGMRLFLRPVFMFKCSDMEFVDVL